MEKEICVGIIIGLAVYSTTYTSNSNYYSKIQKYILYILILFVPLQWFLMLFFYWYNKINKKQTGIIEDEIFIQIKELEKLKVNNLLTDNEYFIKLKILEDKFINNQIKNNNEYKTLYKLKKEGILTINEFEEKVNLLKKKSNSSFYTYFKVSNINNIHSTSNYKRISFLDVFWVILASFFIISFVIILMIM